MALTDRLLKSLKACGKRYEVADTQGLSVRVSRHGTVAFQMRYRFLGKPYRYKLGTYPHTSLAEARDRLRACRKLLDEGKNPVEVEQQALQEANSAWTITQLAEDFLEKKVRRERRRPEYAEYLLNSNVLPKLGSLKVKQATTREIVVVLEEISDRGANVLANRTASIVKQMFTHAVQRGIRADNPCNAISKTTIGGREMPRTRYLEYEEIRTLLKGLAESGISPSMKLATMLLLVTGQRRGELLLGEWTHVDFDKAIWTIPNSLSKNGKPHVVALSPLATMLFTQLRSLANGSRYFVPSTRPGLDQPCDIRALNKALQYVTRKVGLEGCSPHTLRHTFSTLASRLGAPLHVVEKVLNHSLGGMLAVYNHEEFLEQRRQVLNMWAERLTILLKSPKEEPKSPAASTSTALTNEFPQRIDQTPGQIPTRLVMSQPYRISELFVSMQGYEQKP